MWVASCYPPEVGQAPNVVRVDAETLDFERTWPAPSRSTGFIRGLAYGGGSLWVSDIFGDADQVRRTPSSRSIRKREHVARSP